MTTVLMGTNSFVDVETLIGLRNRPLLQVAPSPLRVTLKCPADVPKVKPIEIEENVVKGEASGIRVITRSDVVLVYLNHNLLVTAAQIDDETIHMKVDLRAIGINIYDDANGLHIAGNCFSQNTVNSAGTAINLT